MIEPLALISETDVESHPELPVLAALETALDMTLLALSTWLPELSDPNYDLSRSPDLQAAKHLCSLIERLRGAARDYREILAIFDDPEHPFAAHQPRPDHIDEVDFQIPLVLSDPLSPPFPPRLPSTSSPSSPSAC